MRALKPSCRYDSRIWTSGFSLLETMISLLVLVQVLVGILMLFDSSDKLSRSQGYLAEMQSRQRLAQAELVSMLRSAGLGGLPTSMSPTAAVGGNFGVFPNGLAIAVRNNVAASTKIGDNTTPKIVAGSDVLILRGVFSTPVYFVEPQQPLAVNPLSGLADRHTIQLNKSVDLGVEQDLEPLRKALREALSASPPRPEAIIVRDRFNPGAYAVFQLDPSTTSLGNTGDNTMTVGLTLQAGTSNAEAYGRLTLGTTLLQGAGGETLPLSGGITIQLPREIGTIGLLEEYRLYLRETEEVAQDGNARLTPTLARARFFPGTNTLHPEGSIDLADNFVDLQIAFGIDQPVVGSSPPRGDGLIADTGAQDDEVLYNHANDNDGLSNITTSPWAAAGAQLYFARVHTIAQADRPDRDTPAVDLGMIEDHDLSASIFNSGDHLKVRKQHLETIIELRNLP